MINQGITQSALQRPHLWEIQTQDVVSSIQESVFVRRCSMTSKPLMYHNSVEGNFNFFPDVLLKKDIHVYVLHKLK